MIVSTEFRRWSLRCREAKWRRNFSLEGELSRLTGLTLHVSYFFECICHHLVLKLTNLEKMTFNGGLAPRTLLLGILAGFPRLYEVSWYVRHECNLDVSPNIDGHGLAAHAGSLQKNLCKSCLFLFFLSFHSNPPSMQSC